MLPTAAALHLPPPTTCWFLTALSRRADDDGDGHVLLQLEDDSIELSSLAVQVGRDVTGCTPLPVQGWASCKLAPAAASPEAAEKVVEALRSVQSVMGKLTLTAGFGGGKQHCRKLHEYEMAQHRGPCTGPTAAAVAVRR
jgi:hypothetical protein